MASWILSVLDGFDGASAAVFGGTLVTPIRGSWRSISGAMIASADTDGWALIRPEQPTRLLKPCQEAIRSDRVIVVGGGATVVRKSSVLVSMMDAFAARDESEETTTDGVHVLEWIILGVSIL
jgi:hypothetical protein